MQKFIQSDFKMIIIENKIQEIANTLASYQPVKYGFEGCRGVALFLLQYYQYTKNEIYYNKAIDLIEKEFEFYGEHYDNPSFWTGVAGLGWFCNAIIKKHFDNEYDSGINAMDYLFESMILNDKRLGLYYYDYLHGNLGLANYFISENQFKPLSETVDRLYEFAIIDKYSDGLKWGTYTKHTKNIDFNLSLSHGMSSVVVMLSKIYSLGIQEDKCTYMLEGSINYILTQKLPHGNYNSMYGAMAIESMKPLCDSRMSWCYGDLCVAIALWHASKALNKKDWFNKAIEIFIHASKRRDLKQNHVIDACFCHGTSGIAYIFNKIFKHTGIKEFQEAADYWFDRTLMMCCSEHYPAGYGYWNNEKGYVCEYGILDGIAGIGLSLLSYVSDIDSSWDECLLLS